MLQDFLQESCESSGSLSQDQQFHLAAFLGLVLDSEGCIDPSQDAEESIRSLSSSGFISSVLAAAEPNWHETVDTIGSAQRLELLEQKFKDGKLSDVEYSALRQREAAGAKLQLECEEIQIHLHS